MEETNRAARLLRLMLRDGQALPLLGECDVARGLVERGLARWVDCLSIGPTMEGLAAARMLEGDDTHDGRWP